MPQALLDQMHDITPPPPAPWWPLAPGWWLVLALVLALVAVVSLLAWRRYRNNAVIREALIQLDALAQLADQARHPEPVWYTRLSRLLKQVARARYSDQNPGCLSGRDWSRFLAATGTDGEDRWQELIRASYHPCPDLSADEAILLARRWIRRQSC